MEVSNWHNQYWCKAMKMNLIYQRMDKFQEYQQSWVRYWRVASQWTHKNSLSIIPELENLCTWWTGLDQRCWIPCANCHVGWWLQVQHIWRQCTMHSKPWCVAEAQCKMEWQSKLWVWDYMKGQLRLWQGPREASKCQWICNFSKWCASDREKSNANFSYFVYNRSRVCKWLPSSARHAVCNESPLIDWIESQDADVVGTWQQRSSWSVTQLECEWLLTLQKYLSKLSKGIGRRRSDWSEVDPRQ